MSIKGQTSKRGRSLWELCIICSIFYISKTALNNKVYYFFLKNSDNTNAGEGVEKLNHSYTAGVRCKMLQPL